MLKNLFNKNKIEKEYKKGLIFANKQEYNEAIECFDKALKIDSKRVDILTAKAMALYVLNKYYKAWNFVIKLLN